MMREPLSLQVQDNGAIYMQAQLFLSTWAQAYPGACDPKDFGTTSEDFSGSGSARTSSAIKSFQTWANARGATLRTDGALDPSTFALLGRVAGDAAAKHLAGSPALPAAAKPPEAGFPWGWAAAAAAAVLLFRREIGF